MPKNLKESDIIATGGKVHERSHRIARILLAVSFVTVVPLMLIAFSRFIEYRGFFFYLGGVLGFGILYYFLTPTKYIPRYGYLIADFIFYGLIFGVNWYVYGFVGFHILFFYMLLFGIINALSYNWRDIIITLVGTSVAIAIYNFYSFMPSVRFQFAETAGLTAIELIILAILTVESRVLAEEALVVQRRAVELETELSRIQELDRLKTEFIGIASHQMRTPLSGVKWTLATLKEKGENLTSEQKNLVGLAFENINRMIILVSGMLDVAKIEEQAADMKSSACNLKTLAEEIVSDEKLLAAQKNVFVNIKIPENLTITAGRFALKQALANVIDNAIRYSQKPGSTIIISGHVSDSSVVMTVSDQGIGMTEEEARKAFTKFFRSPEAIKASPDGSGLGLYYTKRIIEQHGGAVSIASKLNEGTAVTIKLPRELKTTHV